MFKVSISRTPFLTVTFLPVIVVMLFVPLSPILYEKLVYFKIYLYLLQWR
jgi:hypothetical protein